MTRTAFLVLLSGIAAFGFGPVDPVNKDGKGIAIKGYDAVAYFDGQPAKGSLAFAHQWMGGTWLFASAANRDRFIAEPNRFAPQYGGYCAYAVSKGHTASVDPEAWRVVDGKLYLNYSKGVQRKWSDDVPGHIASGDRNWPGLHR
ncbi:MAG: YHS domain-containing (seleno)protein [Bryobacteraceae bacterium]